MLAKRTDLIVIASLFLGILLCIFGCLSVKPRIEKGLSNPGNPPLRILKTTIDVSQREELFTQLQKFSNKHDFEFHLTFYDKDKKFFLVEMVRDDIEIRAGDAPKAPTIIDLGFYEAHPANPTPDETVNNLLNDLKSFITEIPDVTIIEER